MIRRNNEDIEEMNVNVDAIEPLLKELAKKNENISELEG